VQVSDLTFFGWLVVRHDHEIAASTRNGTMPTNSNHYVGNNREFAEQTN
jgi:hypothetical protein